ncbi:E3 ubiquitin-protein ligase [Aspergillus melleus]|uniref:E3 ubiquitin-protein ligase n=1 Tax=Aspergillus melleus TaxID=138277 RepID=UPI001E8E5C12|nr:uncharacterized protein LDX57_005594 [Aspergillus melleus]KAH8427891.1 hypothetical protein LDX57_005594 [Aspergillus melleus]
MDDTITGTTLAFIPEVIESEMAFDESDNKVKLDQNLGQTEQENSERITKRLAAISLQERDFAVQRPGEAECVACTETVPCTDIVTVPCSHRYCRTCITRIFQDGLETGVSWPPVCCWRLIPVSLVQSFLGASLSQQATLKIAEDADRNCTYCARTDCGLYVPPQSRSRKDKTRQCAKCKTKTCTACKSLAHRGKCLPDKLLLKFLKMARQVGWRRCPVCGYMIDKYAGCPNVMYLSMWL